MHLALKHKLLIESSFLSVYRFQTSHSTSSSITMSVEFDPVYVDKTWLDTVVVIGITSFVLCLKNLSAVSTAKMGLVYGMIGMTALILGYWLDDAYTFDHGAWVIGCKLCPHEYAM